MKKSLIIILSIICSVALLYAANSVKTYVEKDKCVTCKDCIITCPVSAISIVNNKATIDLEKCINCKLCVKACTYNALKVSK